MQEEKLILSDTEKTYLKDYTTKGVHSARSIRRAHTLLLLSEGLSYQQAAARLGCSLTTVYNLVHRYRECNGHIAETLTERPRSGQPTIITPELEAKVTALACCNEGPDGRDRWTLELMAHKMVEDKVVVHLCDETVRKILKKVSSNPGRRNSGALVR